MVSTVAMSVVFDVRSVPTMENAVTNDLESRK